MWSPLPLASVITPVSIDHVDFLGDTLEKIASEKAAIFKRGVPAVVGRQTEGPLSVIVQRAGEIGAPLHVAGQDWVASEERGRLVYQDEHGLLDLPSPRLFGRHQIDNAGTAIAALRAAGFMLAPAAYDKGLVRADWPARMQRLTAGDLLAHAPAGSEVWLDGAHNPGRRPHRRRRARRPRGTGVAPGGAGRGHAGEQGPRGLPA